MKEPPFRRSLNAYLERHAGPDRPALYDVAEHFPHLLAFDRDWEAIREEMEGVLEGRASLPRYDELDTRQRYLSGDDPEGRSWKVFPLFLMGEKPEENRRRCPRTTELLDRVPDLFQAMFSILEPRKSVPPHCGPYLGYLRYHLGLRVPRVDPPRMRIKDTEHVWEEGKSVVLDDSWEHEVINESHEIRVVLIVDFLRPLPPIPATINRVVCRHVINRIYAKKVAKRVAAFQ